MKLTSLFVFLMNIIMVVATFHCQNLVDVPVSGTISGKISSAKDGSALGDVTVVTDPYTVSVKSAKDGTFVIGTTLAGDYKVTASKEGFSAHSTTVRLAGGATSTADFTLIPDNGDITGKVMDLKRAAPLKGAVVSTVPATGSVVTDSDGKFTLTGLPIGSYDLLVEMDGYEGSPKKVMVSGNATLSLEIALIPTRGSIIGHVYNVKSGMVLHGATIQTSLKTKSVKSDTAGLFSFYDLPCGLCTLIVALDGYASTSEYIAVNGGEISEARIRLKPLYGAIKGTCVNAKSGLRLAEVAISTSPSKGSCTTDTTGTFIFSPLPEGNCTVAAAKEGYTPIKSDATIQGGDTATVYLTLAPVKGTITGCVTDAGTRLPLANTTIATEPATVKTATDSLGFFTLTSITQRTYVLIIEKSGYRTVRESLTVAGGETSAADICLLSLSGTCNGVITSAKNGTVLSGVTLSTTPATHTVTTDIAGVYRFERIPSGSFTIKTSLDNYEPASTTVTITPGEFTSGNMVLTPSTGTINGQVIDKSTDLPLPLANVTTDPPSLSLATDEMGLFSFATLPVGGYRIIAQKQNYCSAEATITLTPGSDMTAALALLPIPDTVGQIQGTITDAVTGFPLSGVQVVSSPATQSAATDAQGAFTLYNVREGTYMLTFTKASYTATQISIEAFGGKTALTEIVLAPSTGNITGTVVDAVTGSPLAGVSVYTSPQTLQVSTDAEGKFSINTITEGRITVYAAKSDYTSPSKQLQLIGGSTVSADFSLIPTRGSIAGRCTNAVSGGVLAGVTIVVSTTGQTMIVNEQGTFQTSGIPSGTCSVSASADGYTTIQRIVSILGGRVTTVDFSLTPNRGSVSGTVTDSRTGDPLADATITTVPSTASAVSSSQGGFSIGSIPVSTYTIIAELDGYTAVTKTITVTAAEALNASFVLTSKNGSITGKVTDADGNAVLDGVLLTTTPATVSVTTDDNGDFIFSALFPRSYTITAKRLGYNDATATVTVTAAQTASANIQMKKILPVLSISTATLNFSTDLNALQMNITNSAGQGVLNYSIVQPESATWLTLSRVDGALTDNSDAVVCSVERGSLEPGNYLADLVVTSNGGSTIVQAVMVVADPGAPQLTLSKSALDFGTAATELEFTIRNTGTGSLIYTIADDMEWLIVTPQSGTLNATPAIISVVANRSFLTQLKTFSGRITVTSNGGNQGMDVTLETAAPPLPPVTLSATDLTPSGCRLIWTPVGTDDRANFTAYRIYSSDKPGFSLSQAMLLATITSSTAAAYSVAATEQITRYYRVYTVNKSDAGTSSNEVAVTFPARLRTWSWVLDSRTYGYTLSDVRSIDDQTAWACGYKGDYGIVLTWDNVTRKWNEATLPQNVDKVFYLQPVSKELCYATASGTVSGQHRAMILKNDNGVWSILSNGPGAEAACRGGDLHVFNENSMYLTYQTTYSTGSIALYQVIDGVWNKTGTNEWYLLFINENCGYATGRNDFIEKYNGYGWTQLPYTDAGTFGRVTAGTDGSIVAHKNNKVFIYSNDLLNHTLDPLLDGYKCQIQTSFALDSTWIWLGGTDHYNYPDRLLHYNGTRFEKVTITDNPAFYQFWFHSKQSGWALANNGIYLYR